MPLHPAPRAPQPGGGSRGHIYRASTKRARPGPAAGTPQGTPTPAPRGHVTAQEAGGHAGCVLPVSQAVCPPDGTVSPGASRRCVTGLATTPICFSAHTRPARPSQTVFLRAGAAAFHSGPLKVRPQAIGLDSLSCLTPRARAPLSTLFWQKQGHPMKYGPPFRGPISAAHAAAGSWPKRKTNERHLSSFMRQVPHYVWTSCCALQRGTRGPEPYLCRRVRGASRRRALRPHLGPGLAF